ncbi:MAG: glycoside hydrolase, partial [Bacteroidota bacterium]
MRILFVFVLVFSLYSLSAQNAPLLLDAAYLNPDGKSWALIDTLSDEFNDGANFDTDKWLTSPETYTNWKGRIPGIFAREAISVENGDLRIRASKLADSIPVMDNGVQKYWTHQGGLVRSREQGRYGMYVECRMKANQTFMSSTFWLINVSWQAGTGCERRVTELDIQECVGTVTNTDNWSQSFDQSMHSNTHDRRPANMGCPPNASAGNNVDLDQGKVYDDYHVYGAWWKSPTEVLFFLDGELQYTVTPPSLFNQPMHVMMVVETYNWNPRMDGEDGMEKPEAWKTTAPESC